jgi:hypothetical protein
LPCKVALGVVLGQSDDPCAPGFGQLHTGRADSAAGTGDQHRFAMFELCTAQQPEVCGGINQPAGGGLFITHTVGWLPSVDIYTGPREEDREDDPPEEARMVSDRRGDELNYRVAVHGRSDVFGLASRGVQQGVMGVHRALGLTGGS